MESTNNCTIATENSCCGSSSPNNAFIQKHKRFITGSIDTPAGKIPLISAEIDSKDRRGGYKARWGINRYNYRIEPGIYGIGSPDALSPVYVSANYKLSFDILRRSLKGLNGWILVLDTKGINVWCAAGKGTFGTGELVKRIQVTGLSKVVFRKKLILPQLGAVGVNAFEVKKKTGFDVLYGPVLAENIKNYIENGFQASESMRTMPFAFKDRLVLTPIQLVNNAKFFILFLLVIFLAGFLPGLKNMPEGRNQSLRAIIILITFYMSGNFLFPLLLPFLPFRSFALKGVLIGIILSIFISLLLPFSLLTGIAMICFSLSIIPFYALLFTGCTTFTSLSGVKKEMRLAMPVLITLFAAGLGFYITGKYF